MFIPNKRNIYCVMTLEVTNDVRIDWVWVDAFWVDRFWTDEEVYCNKCDFKKEEDNSFKNITHLLEKNMMIWKETIIWRTIWEIKKYYYIERKWIV